MSEQAAYAAGTPPLSDTADTMAITFPSGPVKNFARLKVTLAP